MIHTVVLIVLWTVTGTITYLLVRRGYRDDFGKWTQMDRLFWMCLCTAYGPIMLAILIIVGLGMKLGNTAWAKREAQW